VSQPDRPVFVKQLDGSRYAGLNCTCASAAMALDRWTIGEDRTTGAYVRALTGDTTGGTTLAQVNAALHRRWGISLNVQYRYPFESFVDRITAGGQGAILQGWEAVIRDTEWSASPTFGGNHAWFVNGHIEGKGFLVYNPLADGRRDGIAQSPYIIPKAVVREWAGKLNVGAPNQPYSPLGLGYTYAAFTRDTEPHAHFKHGAQRTRPFPDRVRADEEFVRVRESPGRSGVVRPRSEWLSEGDLFTAFQQTDNWLGNHGGTRWVPKRAMRRIGGST
jgi:hypothetical protein